MSRAERRHGGPKKKSYTGWIVLAVLVVVVGGFLIYTNTKGTGVDYTQYAFTDEDYAAPTAKIVIEVYSDFQCPACQALEPTLKAVRDAYKDTVRVEYKEFPLRTLHQYAQQSAEAAECARDQNRFWAYHDVLFESKLLDKRSLKLHAAGLGLDMDAWNTCMDTGAKQGLISRSILEGNGRKVQGTPTLFVNGEEFDGRTIASFEAKITSLQ